MVFKKKHSFLFLLIFLSLFSIMSVSALTLQNGTIITNYCLNQNFTLTQNATIDKIVVNSTCAGDINNITAFYNPVNLSIKNIGSTIGNITLLNVSVGVAIKNETGNQILFVSSVGNKNYNAIFQPNTIIQTSSNTLPPTITIIQPTTADMNIHNPTLSVSLNLPGSCKYNIDNGANISMGSGTFLNSVITVQNGQRIVNVFCNNSILPTESHNSVSFWVYVSAGPTGGSGSGGSGTFENGTGIIVGNNSNVTTQMYNIITTNDKWFSNQFNTIHISVFDINNNSIDPQTLTAYIILGDAREYGLFERKEVGKYTIKFNPIPETYKNVTINLKVKDKLKIIDRKINIKLYEKNNKFLNISIWYYFFITLFLLISLIVIIKGVSFIRKNGKTNL